MDKFPAKTGGSTARRPTTRRSALLTAYFDGNTVTALWNYAQHYAMSDHSYDTEFGRSTPGALNLVSGQTGGVIGRTRPASSPPTRARWGRRRHRGRLLYGDPDPFYDGCASRGDATVTTSGQQHR